MKTPMFLKAASNPGFWTHDEDQIHTMVLREGIIISAKEIEEEVSYARALFFVLTPPRITGDKVADIIIARHRGINMKNYFDDQYFVKEVQFV